MTAPEPPLTDREYAALAGFRHALRVFLHFSEEAARSEGLTPAQHQLLLAVRGSRDGAAAASELAELLQTKLHSTVGLVRRAEESGLVTTEPDPDDRRRQIVRLTDAAADSLERLSAMHRHELRQFRRDMARLLDELD